MLYRGIVFILIVFIELPVVVHPRLAKWTVQTNANVSRVEYALSVPAQVRDQTARPLDFLSVFTNESASDFGGVFARSLAFRPMQIDLLIIEVNHPLDVLTKCSLTEVVNPI